jgi:hypothetical protein
MQVEKLDPVGDEDDDIDNDGDSDDSDDYLKAKRDAIAAAMSGNAKDDAEAGERKKHMKKTGGNPFAKEGASEKRWKQTSMDPQAAILKFGKENVKVKKGGLRNGDDMVSVLVDDDTDEGNAYAHAVRKAKMNGAEKGDKIDHPNSDEDDIVIEKDKTPLGEFILSYFDRQTGQFPKGETAVLTSVEKDYGDQYVKPASQFIERLGHVYEKYQARKMADFTRIQELAGLR